MSEVSAHLFDNSPNMLSADLVKLLHAHVVYFLTMLMNKTITLKEQEMKLKKGTKVWKVDGKVSIRLYFSLFSTY